MALVREPVWRVTFSFVDEGGSIGKTQLFAPATVTAADLNTAIGLIADDIQTLSGATLAGVDANLSYTEDAPMTPNADVVVEDRGQFVVLAGVKKPTYSIPGFLGNYVKANGNIDGADAAVQAFMDELIDGPWVDSNGSAITRVLKAYALRRRTANRQRPIAESLNFDGLPA